MGWVFHNRINKDGTRAIIYHVYYGGKMFPVSTGVRCKESAFKKGIVKGDIRATVKLDTIKSIILTSLENAKHQMPEWSIDTLKANIRARIEGHTDDDGAPRYLLYEYWGKRIEYYRKSGREHSALHSSNSRMQVFKVLSEDIYIDQLTKKHPREILEKLEAGRSSSTLNGYFRDLRVIINLAIEEDIIKVNPFKGFRLPKMKTRANAALTWEELQRFKTVKVKTNYQEQVRDMAMFRYYCLGMRIKDQLNLTTSNLKGNTLSYITSKNKKKFEFTLDQECIDIINRYKKGKLLFPVPTKMEDAYRHMNKSLKLIAGYAGIEKSISTHTFRHTFASINANMSINDLQRSLGHGSAKTTEGYKQTLENQDHLINQIRK